MKRDLPRPRFTGRPARSAFAGPCARLSRRLEEFRERARRDPRSFWALQERARLRQARLLLFGSAPE